MTARENHPFGVYGGINEPSQSKYGGDIAYNISNWGRISAGAGNWAYGAMMHFFLIPRWDFTPVIGVGASQTSYPTNATKLGLQIGVDYTTRFGLFIAAGFTYLDVGFFF